MSDQQNDKKHLVERVKDYLLDLESPFSEEEINALWPDNVGDYDRWQDPRDISGGETDCAPSATRDTTEPVAWMWETPTNRGLTWTRCAPPDAEKATITPLYTRSSTLHSGLVERLESMLERYAGFGHEGLRANLTDAIRALRSAKGDSSLPADILALCRARGWNLHWTHRGAYLHLESSELIEALRGKRGDPLHEAADVLIVLMSITENAGLPWPEVMRKAREICEGMKTRPRYPGEEHEVTALDRTGEQNA